MSRTLNRASYDAIVREWDAARTGFSGREQALLDRMLDGLPAHSPVLDLGCGTGQPIGTHIVARGHALTGVDQSAGMLAIARRRLPQATWLESDIASFDSTTRFAAVVCWDALFHVERALHQGILARITSLLAPGGRLALTAGGSDHPAFTDTMFGRHFFYDSHPPERLERLLRELGWHIDAAEFLNPPTDGRDKGRYAVVASLPVSGR